MSNASSMTATDRRELRKVAKGRFEILEEQLNLQVQQVKNQIAKEIDAEVEPIIKGYDKKRDALLELEITEELALGALQSDEAKAFLDKIPSADKLLPAPTKDEIKQLVSGS